MPKKSKKKKESSPEIKDQNWVRPSETGGVISSGIDYFKMIDEELFSINTANNEGFSAGYNGDLYVNPYHSQFTYLPSTSWRRGYEDGRKLANQKMLEMD